MTEATSYLLIRQASAAKLGLNASGLIHYAVLADFERVGIYIALTGNESGGYFSREAIPLSAIEQCAQGGTADSPLRAVAFKPAFNGKSTNNSGFMAAVLVAEGLLNKAPTEGSGKGHVLIDNGLWDAWREDCLSKAQAAGAELPVFRIGAAASAPQGSEESETQAASPEAADTATGDASEAFSSTEAHTRIEDSASEAGESTTEAIAAKPRRKGKGAKE